MKAKTKLQIQIADLKDKLPGITNSQSEYAWKNGLDNWAVISRGRIYCTECGHSWKGDSNLSLSIIGAECPECGKQLKLRQHYNGEFKDSCYFTILTTKGVFQVIRMFLIGKYCKKNQSSVSFTKEVIQHWIREDGKSEFLCKSVQGMSMYYDQWVDSSEISFHNYRGGYSSQSRYDLTGFITYPNKSILPALKRNGFKGFCYGLAPQRFFPYLLSNKMAETMLKAGQTELFKYGCENENKIEKYWPSIRIAIRNGYIVKDASLWLDTLEFLEYFGKDLHNAFYVCPENLHKLHDKLMNKKQAILDREAYERKKAKMDQDQKGYAEAMSKFFDLFFTQDELAIVPLRSVEEFAREGEALHHCVYSGNYYTRHDSLIMSARIEDKPIETIEVSLKSLKIVQARGLQNKPTKHHKRILDLIQANIPQIAKKVKY